MFAKFDTSEEKLEALSAELGVKALPVFKFYKVCMTWQLCLTTGPGQKLVQMFVPVCVCSCLMCVCRSWVCTLAQVCVLLMCTAVCTAHMQWFACCSCVLLVCTACVQDGHEVVQQVVGYKKKPLEAAVEQLAGMAK